MGHKLRPDRRFEDEVTAAAPVEWPKGLHEGIHTAGKHIKRLRALCRLIAGHATDFQRQENSGLSDMAHSLATSATGMARGLGRPLPAGWRDPPQQAGSARPSDQKR